MNRWYTCLHFDANALCHGLPRYSVSIDEPQLFRASPHVDFSLGSRSIIQGTFQLILERHNAPDL